MKKVLTILILAIASANQIQAFCNESISITVIPSDNVGKEKPGKGSRIPPRPIYCTIDFDNSAIISTSSLISNADEFCISAESGVCIYSSESETEFVDTLKTLHGIYIITISGDDYTLSGYFEQ